MISIKQFSYFSTLCDLSDRISNTGRVVNMHKLIGFIECDVDCGADFFLSFIIIWFNHISLVEKMHYSTKGNKIIGFISFMSHIKTNRNNCGHVFVCFGSEMKNDGKKIHMIWLGLKIEKWTKYELIWEKGTSSSPLSSPPSLLNRRLISILDSFSIETEKDASEKIHYEWCFFSLLFFPNFFIRFCSFDGNVIRDAF